MEIEMFFAKYDVDGDGEFSMEEGGKLIDDLDHDRIDAGVSICKTSQKITDRFIPSRKGLKPE